MPTSEPTTPDYLVIGHISKDLLTEGYAPGGTALYSALTAARLGLKAAVVTAFAPGDMDLLEVLRAEGAAIHAVPSLETTTFRNSYDRQGRRTQVLSGRANLIRYVDIPEAWLGAPIIHLGPVAQELPGDLPALMPGSVRVLGITPQGWMRTWDEQGRVTQSAKPVPDALHGLPKSSFIVTSLEDLGYDTFAIRNYVNLTTHVAITDGFAPASIYEHGAEIRVPALHGEPVDPTGAGDVFAAAIFVYYMETGDLRQAARFAHAAAICNIEGQGVSGVPARERVAERLARHDSGDI